MGVFRWRTWLPLDWGLIDWHSWIRQKFWFWQPIQSHLNRLKIAYLNDVFYLMLIAMEFKDVGGWTCIPSCGNQTFKKGIGVGQSSWSEPSLEFMTSFRMSFECVDCLIWSVLPFGVFFPLKLISFVFSLCHKIYVYLLFFFIHFTDLVH